MHETVGGFPVLVSGGRSVARAHCASYFCDRNPRTGVGLTPSGRLLLVVVDGRRPGWSSGMRLDEFANLFLYLGADRAMNLDGGGSSTMVVAGRVVNRPTDFTGERPVSSSLLVRSGYDPGDPKRSLTAPPALPSALSSADAARAALDDPGSTGGMLAVLSAQRP